MIPNFFSLIQVEDNGFFSVIIIRCTNSYQILIYIPIPTYYVPTKKYSCLAEENSSSTRLGLNSGPDHQFPVTRVAWAVTAWFLFQCPSGQVWVQAIGKKIHVLVPVTLNQLNRWKPFPDLYKHYDVFLMLYIKSSSINK